MFGKKKGKQERKAGGTATAVKQKQGTGKLRWAAAVVLIGVGLVLATAFGLILLGLLLIEPAAAGSNAVLANRRNPDPIRFAPFHRSRRQARSRLAPGRFIRRRRCRGLMRSEGSYSCKIG